jgi:hypothetical protein
MKFVKTLSGNYKSENGKYEIRKYGGRWEVYNKEDKFSYTDKFVASYNTLKEAKESIK